MKWSFIGALSMALAVIAGAFGAHALKNSLAPEMLTVWETAARYQIYHSLGLILLGLFQNQSSLKSVGWLFVVGIILFSGSLYALVLTGISQIGMLTPLGGMAWIVGWLLFAKRLYSYKGA